VAEEAVSVSRQPVQDFALRSPADGQRVDAVPDVPAEARAAAQRVADAYASGDAQAVVSLMNRDGRLSQLELDSMAGEVKRWWFLQPGEPLSIAATRWLPPVEPGEGERVAVELRTSDDAGLRVVVRQDGLFWRVQDVLTIAPTASRNGAGR
jgi:hypothetical protein